MKSFRNKCWDWRVKRSWAWISSGANGCIRDLKKWSIRVWLLKYHRHQTSRDLLVASLPCFSLLQDVLRVCFAATQTRADSGDKLLTLHSTGSRWAVTERTELQSRTDWAVLESCFFFFSHTPTWMYKYIIQMWTAVYLWCDLLFYGSEVETRGCVLRSELCLYSWPKVSESYWGMPSLWPAVRLSRKSATSFPGELLGKCLLGMSVVFLWLVDTSRGKNKSKESNWEYIRGANCEDLVPVFPAPATFSGTGPCFHAFKMKRTYWT